MNDFYRVCLIINETDGTNGLPYYSMWLVVAGSKFSNLRLRISFRDCIRSVQTCSNNLNESLNTPIHRGVKKIMTSQQTHQLTDIIGKPKAFLSKINKKVLVNLLHNDSFELENTSSAEIKYIQESLAEIKDKILNVILEDNQN